MSKTSPACLALVLAYSFCRQTARHARELPPQRIFRDAIIASHISVYRPVNYPVSYPRANVYNIYAIILHTFMLIDIRGQWVCNLIYDKPSLTLGEIVVNYDNIFLLTCSTCTSQLSCPISETVWRPRWTRDIIIRRSCARDREYE